MVARRLEEEARRDDVINGALDESGGSISSMRLSGCLLVSPYWWERLVESPPPRLESSWP
jgi:hypothetical protein